MVEKSYEAVVQKIIQNGKNGPYAVARSDELGSVTFALSRKVWREPNRPEPGVYVILSQLMKKRAGWRANSGRFVKPADQQIANNPLQRIR